MLWLMPKTFPSLLHIFCWIFDTPPKTPISCVTSSPDLVTLASCLDQFTIPHAHYNSETYHAAQPTQFQRSAWVSLVHELLSVDGSCATVAVPLPLRTFYSVKTFRDIDGSFYCVLAEHSVDCDGYALGWGHIIVPATLAAVSRNIHLSAPHPQYDLGTMEQATALFKLSGARSLLLAGRTRTAFLRPSGCVAASTPNQHYYETDPAHNTLEPFVDASLAIYNWQRQNGGCPSSSCAFIQIHGKSPSTCTYDQMFLSAGLGNSISSKAWYTSPINHPVKRLKHNLDEVFPMWNISLPSDSSCILTATKNVIGRFINGVPRSDVCTTPARASTATGEFVHIEQDRASRNPQSYKLWGRALRRSFDASCAAGMSMDPVTEMCTLDTPQKGELLGAAPFNPWWGVTGELEPGFSTKWLLWTSLLNVV